MFEVGKKYIPKDVPTGIPVTCMYVSDLSEKPSTTTGMVVFEDSTGSEFAITSGHAYRLYKEYKEPRSLKRYMIVIEGGTGRPFPAFYENGDSEIIQRAREEKLFGIRNLKVLDIVEINWVEKNV